MGIGKRHSLYHLFYFISRPVDQLLQDGRAKGEFVFEDSNPVEERSLFGNGPNPVGPPTAYARRMRKSRGHDGFSPAPPASRGWRRISIWDSHARAKPHRPAGG